MTCHTSDGVSCNVCPWSLCFIATIGLVELISDACSHVINCSCRVSNNLRMDQLTPWSSPVPAGCTQVAAGWSSLSTARCRPNSSSCQASCSPTGSTTSSSSSSARFCAAEHSAVAAAGAARTAACGAASSSCAKQQRPSSSSPVAVVGAGQGTTCSFTCAASRHAAASSSSWAVAGAVVWQQCCQRHQQCS